MIYRSKPARGIEVEIRGVINTAYQRYYGAKSQNVDNLLPTMRRLILRGFHVTRRLLSLLYILHRGWPLRERYRMSCASLNREQTMLAAKFPARPGMPPPMRSTRL